MRKACFVLTLVMLLASCFQNDAVDRYTAKVWEASAATWANDAHVYATNELLFCSDCPAIKRGDGVHRYSQLPALGGDSAKRATELAMKVAKTGDNMTGNLGIQSGAANKHLIAMNLSNSSSTGSKSFDANSYYLGLGHREWNVGTYRLMGFGFRYNFTDHYPVVIGYQETSGSSSTYGDFGIWTRPVTTNTAPLLRMKVTAAGNIKSYGPIAAPEDIATKGYVDSSYMAVKTFTSSGGTISLVGTPPKTFINSNVSGAVTYTLPPVHPGAIYTLWKIGTAVHTISGPVSDVGKTGTKIVSDSTAGSTITFTCSGTYWVVTSKNGTWTTQ